MSETLRPWIQNTIISSASHRPLLTPTPTHIEISLPIPNTPTAQIVAVESYSPLVTVISDRHHKITAEFTKSCCERFAAESGHTVLGRKGCLLRLLEARIVVRRPRLPGGGSWKWYGDGGERAERVKPVVVVERVKYVSDGAGGQIFGVPREVVLERDVREMIEGIPSPAPETAREERDTFTTLEPEAGENRPAPQAGSSTGGATQSTNDLATQTTVALATQVTNAFATQIQPAQKAASRDDHSVSTVATQTEKRPENPKPRKSLLAEAWADFDDLEFEGVPPSARASQATASQAVRVKQEPREDSLHQQVATNVSIHPERAAPEPQPPAPPPKRKDTQPARPEPERHPGWGDWTAISTEYATIPYAQRQLLEQPEAWFDPAKQKKRGFVSGYDAIPKVQLAPKTHSPRRSPVRHPSTPPLVQPADPTPTEFEASAATRSPPPKSPIPPPPSSPLLPRSSPPAAQNSQPSTQGSKDSQPVQTGLVLLNSYDPDDNHFPTQGLPLEPTSPPRIKRESSPLLPSPPRRAFSVLIEPTPREVLAEYIPVRFVRKSEPAPESDTESDLDSDAPLPGWYPSSPPERLSSPPAPPSSLPKPLTEPEMGTATGGRENQRSSQLSYNEGITQETKPSSAEALKVRRSDRRKSTPAQPANPPKPRAVRKTVGGRGRSKIRPPSESEEEEEEDEKRGKRRDSTEPPFPVKDPNGRTDVAKYGMLRAQQVGLWRLRRRREKEERERGGGEKVEKGKKGEREGRGVYDVPMSSMDVDDSQRESQRQDDGGDDEEGEQRGEAMEIDGDQPEKKEIPVEIEDSQPTHTQPSQPHSASDPQPNQQQPLTLELRNESPRKLPAFSPPPRLQLPLSDDISDEELPTAPVNPLRNPSPIRPPAAAPPPRPQLPPSGDDSEDDIPTAPLKPLLGNSLVARAIAASTNTQPTPAAPQVKQPAVSLTLTQPSFETEPCSMSLLPTTTTSISAEPAAPPSTAPNLRPHVQVQRTPYTRNPLFPTLPVDRHEEDDVLESILQTNHPALPSSSLESQAREPESSMGRGVDNPFEEPDRREAREPSSSPEPPQHQDSQQTRASSSSFEPAQRTEPFVSFSEWADSPEQEKTRAVEEDVSLMEIPPVRENMRGKRGEKTEMGRGTEEGGERSPAVKIKEESPGPLSLIWRTEEEVAVRSSPMQSPGRKSLGTVASAKKVQRESINPSPIQKQQKQAPRPPPVQHQRKEIRLDAVHTEMQKQRKGPSKVSLAQQQRREIELDVVHREMQKTKKVKKSAEFLSQGVRDGRRDVGGELEQSQRSFLEKPRATPEAAASAQPETKPAAPAEIKKTSRPPFAPSPAKSTPRSAQGASLASSRAGLRPQSSNKPTTAAPAAKSITRPAPTPAKEQRRPPQSNLPSSPPITASTPSRWTAINDASAPSQPLLPRTLTPPAPLTQKRRYESLDPSPSQQERKKMRTAEELSRWRVERVRHLPSSPAPMKEAPEVETPSQAVKGKVKKVMEQMPEMETPPQTVKARKVEKPTPEVKKRVAGIRKKMKAAAGPLSPDSPKQSTPAVESGLYAGLRERSIKVPGYGGLSRAQREELERKRREWFGTASMVGTFKPRYREEEEGVNKGKEKGDEWWRDKDTPMKRFARGYGKIKEVRREGEGRW